MQHRLVGHHRLGPAEHPARPLAAVLAPVQRGRQPGLLPVLPAGRRPPARVIVSAAGDELGVRAAGHRRGVEEERRDVDGMRGPLVVQGPGFGGGAHRERAAWHQDLRRQPGRVGVRRGRGSRGQHRGSGPDLVRDQHGLVVLHLVLGDHPEREPVPDPPPGREPGVAEPGPVEQVQDPAADLMAVGPRLVGRQQRQCRALRAGMLERVVERVDFRVQGFAAADLAQQPELFLVGDVREVPDQRRHQRRVLPDQVGLVHAVGEQRRPLPRAGQFPADQLPQGLGGASFGVSVKLGHATPSSWSSAGHRSFST